MGSRCTGAAPTGSVRVRDCWKGHPAFGVKLQNHRPFLAGSRPGHGFDAPTLVSPERLALMDAQKAEVLRQAGFAA